MHQGKVRDPRGVGWGRGYCVRVRSNVCEEKLGVFSLC